MLPTTNKYPILLDVINNYLVPTYSVGVTPVSGRPTTLYRFFNGAGDLLYVGITHRGLKRWSEHAEEKSWWLEVSATTTKHFPDRESAVQAETAAIRSENPRYNVASTGPRGRPNLDAVVPLPASDGEWDLDELLANLVDAAGAAELLGIATKSVAVYRDRYPDFPKPVLPTYASNRGHYWFREDLIGWRNLGQRS
jgi:hypothetical protein